MQTWISNDTAIFIKEVQDMFQKENGCNFLSFTELPYEVPKVLKTQDVIKMTSSEKKKNSWFSYLSFTLLPLHLLFLTASQAYI